MKYTVALTLVISLVFFGFGGYLVNAQGVNHEVRPRNNDQINPQRITYQQIYEGNQDLIEINKQQSAEIGILLKEYFDKRNKIINNIEYNKDELRRNILTNGAMQEENLFSENIAAYKERLINLRNEYLSKMRAVLTGEQFNKITENNYIVNIGDLTGGNYKNGISISGYPIKGRASNNRFSSNTDSDIGFQCGINYLKRGY